jgi:hypothetical protein
MLRRALLAMTASLALCGCANQPYPQDWAAPVRTAGCAAVTGLYGGKGRESAGQLYLLLGPVSESSQDDMKRIATVSAIDRVEIASDGPKTLVLHFRDATQEIATLRYPDAECGSDGVTVVYYAGMTRGRTNPLAGVEHDTATLSKAADGALIVRRHETDAGLVYMFLPVGMSDSSWSRYPAFKPD